MNHPPRAVRLFVSSTFADMQAEREELIRRVFPILRERCEARGVNWGEVDLRWGVTHEKASDGQVLPICLAEIDGCRPFFLAVLGDRYGWIPDQIDRDLIALQPWLAEFRGRSVTELEIRHGALNDPSRTALFYARDPRWLDRLGDQNERARYESADPEAGRLLGMLKAEIGRAGYRLCIYADAADLGRLVLGDLTALLDSKLPAGPPDGSEQDSAAQRALIDRLAESHVGREAELCRLDTHASARSVPGPLVVAGPPGSGKSALLAAWIARRAAAVPKAEGILRRWLRRRGWTGDAGGGAFVPAHFAGASVESSDVPGMLRRLAAELGSRFGFSPGKADDPIGLSATFANALSRASASGSSIFVIDGLDQLDPRGQGLDLAWLPLDWPRGTRLIVSSGPGPVLELLKARGWPTLELGELGPSDRRTFASAYLRENHRKEIDIGELDAIQALEAGRTARYLSTFLEELVASAKGIEDLGELIAANGRATTLEGLFDRVLDRIERQHGLGRPGLVAKALGLLWASRHGLSDREACELLGPPGDLLPSASWVPLRRELRPFASARKGLTGLTTPGIRATVERRFLADPTYRAGARRALADYFAARPIGPRVVEELPWQLASLGDWPALAQVLCDPPFLVAAWPVHRFEVRSYWAAIESHTSIRADELLKSRFLEPGADPSAELAAADILASLNRRPAALRLASGLVASPIPAIRAPALDLTAGLALELGDLATARDLSVRQRADAAEAGNADALLAALARLAAIHRRLGEADLARARLDEAERLAGSSGARDRLADLVGQRALLAERRGELAEALALCDRRATLARQLGDLVALQDALTHRGKLLGGLRRSGPALRTLDEAESIARRLRDPAALQACLGERAEVLIGRRRLDEALRALDERERLLREELHDNCGVAGVLLQRARLFGDVMKRTAAGIALIDEAEELARRSDCREVLGRSRLVRDGILAARLRGQD